jgi:hypothetical protein
LIQITGLSRVLTDDGLENAAARRDSMKKGVSGLTTVSLAPLGLALLSWLAVGCSAPPSEDAAGDGTGADVAAEEPVEAERAAEAPAPREPAIVEVEVPAGTILELELLGALDSSVQRAGDEIQAKTLSPLYVDGALVLGAGAHVEGRVTEVEASGRVKGRARLAFTFDRLRTPTGPREIRTSYVAEEAASGKKKDAAVIGGAAGVGAVVGGIIGGKKGAAIGAAIGGAGGTGVVLTTKGEEIRLPAGTQLNVRLDEPVVIRRN